MHDAHHHRCRTTGPSHALAGGVDLTAVRTDPPQPGRAGVALTDRVRRDQPERAVGAQEVKPAAEEVGDEISVAVAVGVRLLQPVRIALDVGLAQRVLARERRVPDDRVEPRALTAEHLWELDLPVERYE